VISIDIKNQTLEYAGKSYQISSAKNGTGNKEGSLCTPLGRFKIAEKIGSNLEINSVLVAREATGETYNSSMSEQFPDRDWILTRILWLDGIDKHNKNTKDRYIYIHGSPDETPVGVPGSKGCIRMLNKDIIELFDAVESGEEVVIIE